jgi:hypothetical protein
VNGITEWWAKFFNIQCSFKNFHSLTDQSRANIGVRLKSLVSEVVKISCNSVGPRFSNSHHKRYSEGGQRCLREISSFREVVECKPVNNRSAISC